MKKKILLLLGLLVLMFSSCEKTFMADDVENTPNANFNYLWQQVNEHYSLFDVKNVDWQAVYDSLSPKVNDAMSEDALFDVMRSMLNPLNDGHVNLIANYDASHCDSIYYHFYKDGGIDNNAIILNYLGLHYHTTGGFIHGGLCDGKVAYVSYQSFSSSISYNGLVYLLSTYANAEGMILDLRGNGGGSINNIYIILSVMPSHGQKLYSSQIKNGKGHDDFGPLQDTYAPDSSSLRWNKPVYVLIDRGCFSATSMFAISTMAYDNMTLMGDTTSGGLGLPIMGYLPNGWRYRFPVTRVFAIDGKNYENGVPPQIPLKFDRQLMQQQGRDNIIDSACALISGQHSKLAR